MKAGWIQMLTPSEQFTFLCVKYNYLFVCFLLLCRWRSADKRLIYAPGISSAHSLGLQDSTQKPLFELKTWFNQLWWLSFLCLAIEIVWQTVAGDFLSPKMRVTTSTATASVIFFVKKKIQKTLGRQEIHKWAESSDRGTQGIPLKIQSEQQKHVGTKSKLIQGSPDMSPDFLFKVGSLKNVLRFFLFGTRLTDRRNN